MKCVFISCFNIYDIRIRPIETFLKKRGIECHYITSDYDHNAKSEYISERKGAKQISVIKYTKNLSIKRLISHFLFAKKAMKEVAKINPDMVYIILPPNFLVRYFSRYRKKNKIKLIYDIYDLWPETFPFEKTKSFLSIPFKIWRNLRDKNISNADFVITECNLFQHVLQDPLKNVKTKTLYLSKDEYKNNIIETNVRTDKIHLCYLGSINNIIDIPKIKLILKEVAKNKEVVFHIVGDGENRNKLIDEALNAGVDVKFHGKIYNAEEKMEIFRLCHFGINIMKDSVCVGLTMKSIDYFQSSLPILNNIPADTAELVDKYNIGFNISNNNIKKIGSIISSITKEDLLVMKENTNKVFKKYFSTEAANENLKIIFEDLYKN